MVTRKVSDERNFVVYVESDEPTHPRKIVISTCEIKTGKKSGKERCKTVAVISGVSEALKRAVALAYEAALSGKYLETTVYWDGNDVAAFSGELARGA
jgi:hypothetical protein